MSENFEDFSATGPKDEQISEVAAELWDFKFEELKGLIKDQNLFKAMQSACWIILDDPRLDAKRKAAVLLAGIVDTEVAAGVKYFLENNPELDPRVVEVLQASLFRMESF